MKFLIYGNSPTTGTGYGIQIAHLARQLKRAGHDVAVACTYGHQVGVNRWATEWGDVRLYPSGFLANSEDLLLGHAEHFFEGDPQAGWVITVTDQWVLKSVPLKEFRVLAWTPVDHWPCPPEVIEFIHRSGATRRRCHVSVCR